MLNSTGVGRNYFLAGLVLACLLPTGADAQEIAGGECDAGATLAGQFDAGWFHNRPTVTRRQDGYWPDAPSGPIFYWDNPRDNAPLGADVSTIANYAPDEVVGPGLAPGNEPGASRYNYVGVGGAGTGLAQAVADGD